MYVCMYVCVCVCVCVCVVMPSGSVVKNVPDNARDAGIILSWKDSPREGTDNPLQYACLKNPMDRGAWWDAVHGVAKELDTHKTTTHTHIIYTHAYACIYIHLYEYVPIYSFKNCYFQVTLCNGSIKGIACSAFRY